MCPLHYAVMIIETTLPPLGYHVPPRLSRAPWLYDDPLQQKHGGINNFLNGTAFTDIEHGR